MNGRERFQALMHFRPVDRVPNIEVGFWGAAQERWLKEGMPAHARRDDIITFHGDAFFGLDEQRGMDLHFGMLPGLESKVLEKDDHTITVLGGNGVVTRSMKDGSSMPQFISYPITSRADFATIRRQYDAAAPQRFPADWNELKAWAPARQCPLWGPGMAGGGFYSVLRGWMGTENACTVFYDDPAWAHEMLDFIADFQVSLLERALPQVVPDYFMWWEDFAFKNGPLVSPAIFREFLQPRYRRVNDVLRRFGVDVVFVDSDGNPSVLFGLMLEAGINGTYPMEAAAGMDPLAIRREFGRELLLWGGIDKRALAAGRTAIEKELYRKLPPLLEQGGYMPQLDHMAPPDISYDNWMYYLDLKRELLSR